MLNIFLTLLKNMYTFYLFKNFYFPTVKVPTAIELERDGGERSSERLKYSFILVGGWIFFFCLRGAKYDDLLRKKVMKKREKKGKLSLYLGEKIIFLKRRWDKNILFQGNIQIIHPWIPCSTVARMSRSGTRRFLRERWVELPGPRERGGGGRRHWWRGRELRGFWRRWKWLRRVFGRLQATHAW